MASTNPARQITVVLIALAIVFAAAAGRKYDRVVQAAARLDTTMAKDLADIPPELRKRNWRGTGGGSCMWANSVMMLRWHGFDELATYFEENYSGGESFTNLVEVYDQHGLDWAGTGDGDISFLEWATRNRLPVNIDWDYEGSPISHVVLLIDLTPYTATLLDNNSIWTYRVVERQEFERRWRQSGANAVCLVYPPAPPWPSVGD